MSASPATTKKTKKPAPVNPSWESVRVSLGGAHEELCKEYPEAQRIVIEAMTDLSAKQFDPQNSMGIVEVALLNVASRSFTTEIPTFCVTIGADRQVRLFLNPEFVLTLGVVGTKFGLQHEAYHLIHRHLHLDRDVPTNWDRSMTHACEIIINDKCLKYHGHTMPTAQREVAPTATSKGTAQGDDLGIVDPKREYKSWKERMLEAGKAASDVTYDDFTRDEYTLAGYLRQAPPPEDQTKVYICGHGDEQIAGGEPLDGVSQEAVEEALAEALSPVVRKARDGNESAREALGELGEQLGEDSKLYGSLGLGELFGTSTSSKRTAYWEMFLSQALASRLVPGDRTAYPKRMIGLSDLYEEEEAGLPFMPVADEYERTVLIALDTSGSMPDGILERLVTLVGHMDNTKVTYITFDHDFYFHEIGTQLVGRGGTSFDTIENFLASEACEDPEPDAILVVTDGFAPPIDPKNSDRWVWLITPEGDTWPKDHGMATVIVDIPAAT